MHRTPMSYMWRKGKYYRCSYVVRKVKNMEWWQIILIIIAVGIVLEEIITSVCKTIMVCKIKDKENEDN